MKYLPSLIIMLAVSISGICQSNKKWDTLFYDRAEDLHVEIMFTTMRDSCGDGSTPTHRFAYRIKPTQRKHNYFIAWKMSYLDCNGKLYAEERSLDIAANEESSHDIESGDFLFVCSRIMDPHYDASISHLPRQGTTLLALPESTVPTGIDGDQTIYMGQSTTLSVRGGLLGVGADWYWYTERCGGTCVGKGNTITVSPMDPTEYFVRAEGSNNITPCTRFVVNVDQRSTAANSIDGTNEICRGQSTTLTVMGGSLGLLANWVWYANDCEGQKVGTGNSITIAPGSTTTYFVRAEGALNNTICKRITIQVFEKSVDPVSISSSGSTTICQGNPITLRVNGGQLSDGAEWKWYADRCGGTVVSTGSEARFYPISNTTYYVSGEGLCNSTRCVSITVGVNELSKPATYIDKPEEIMKNKKTVLSASGGSLGEAAQWQWYKNDCSFGRYVGSGRSIVVRTRKPTTYYVKAKGLCNETQCITTTVFPAKAHHWSKAYADRRSKFMAVGLGIGLEWAQFRGLADVIDNVSGTPTYGSSEVTINGLGLKTELSLYPLMKDYLSLGFLANYSTGLSASFLSGDANSDDIDQVDESYRYHRIQFETELAFGFNRGKFLIKLRRNSQSNDFEKSITTYSNYRTEYKFNQEINRETLSFGVRLGRYVRNKGDFLANNFDILYTLSRTHAGDMTASFKDFQGLSDWNVGVGLGYWKQSAVKFQFEMTLRATQSSFSFGSDDFSGATYLVSLIYNRNSFY